MLERVHSRFLGGGYIQGTDQDSNDVKLDVAGRLRRFAIWLSRSSIDDNYVKVEFKNETCWVKKDSLPPSTGGGGATTERRTNWAALAKLGVRRVDVRPEDAAPAGAALDTAPAALEPAIVTDMIRQLEGGTPSIRGLENQVPHLANNLEGLGVEVTRDGLRDVLIACGKNAGFVDRALGRVNWAGDGRYEGPAARPPAPPAGRLPAPPAGRPRPSAAAARSSAAARPTGGGVAREIETLVGRILAFSERDIGPGDRADFDQLFSDFIDLNTRMRAAGTFAGRDDTFREFGQLLQKAKRRLEAAEGSRAPAAARPSAAAGIGAPAAPRGAVTPPAGGVGVRAAAPGGDFRELSYQGLQVFRNSLRAAIRENPTATEAEIEARLREKVAQARDELGDKFPHVLAYIDEKKTAAFSLGDFIKSTKAVEMRCAGGEILEAARREMATASEAELQAQLYRELSARGYSQFQCAELRADFAKPGGFATFERQALEALAEEMGTRRPINFREAYQRSLLEIERRDAEALSAPTEDERLMVDVSPILEVTRIDYPHASPQRLKERILGLYRGTAGADPDRLRVLMGTTDSEMIAFIAAVDAAVVKGAPIDAADLKAVKASEQITAGVRGHTFSPVGGQRMRELGYRTARNVRGDGNCGMTAFLFPLGQAARQGMLTPRVFTTTLLGTERMVGRAVAGLTQAQQDAIVERWRRGSEWLQRYVQGPSEANLQLLNDDPTLHSSVTFALRQIAAHNLVNRPDLIFDSMDPVRKLGDVDINPELELETSIVTQGEEAELHMVRALGKSLGFNIPMYSDGAGGDATLFRPIEVVDSGLPSLDGVGIYRKGLGGTGGHYYAVFK